MAAPPVAVRPAADREVPATVDLLRRTGFGGTVDRLLEWPRRSPRGAVLVSDDGYGAACCASFGTTGWIGALGVVPEARGRGVGTTLMHAAVAWLRERGARTVFLYATDMGRPVYERAGFVAEGAAVAWHGHAGEAPAVPVRRLGEADRRAIAALDVEATGEDRVAVLGAVAPLRGTGAGAGGPGQGLRGFALRTPWGNGPGICARDPAAGVALMAAATREPGGGTLVVPAANRVAMDAAQAWRLTRLNEAQRMRLGPPVAWAPGCQFGLFNLFWG